MQSIMVETFVAQVVADAERSFGRQTDPALLERYARETVLALWCERPVVTDYLAELALRQVRDAIERRRNDEHETVADDLDWYRCAA